MTRRGASRQRRATGSRSSAGGSSGRRTSPASPRARAVDAAGPAGLYTRVSTDGPGDPELGLEAQGAKCAAYAAAMGYGPTRTVPGAAAPDERPGLGPALAKLDAGRAAMLVAASLSRIGRRAYDVLAVAERAERHGWNLALLDLHLDTRSPGGCFALTALAAVARLGCPVELDPETLAVIGRVRADGNALAATVNECNGFGGFTPASRPRDGGERDARDGVEHHPAGPCRGPGTGARGRR